MLSVEERAARITKRMDQLRRERLYGPEPKKEKVVEMPVTRRNETPSPRLAARKAANDELVREEVAELIQLVETKSPSQVSQWLRRRLNQYLDEELEVLATHVLAEMDLPHNLPEVRGPLFRGEYERGLDALVSRLRRRFAKLLRDHQRGEDDAFYDSCVVE